MRASGRPTPSPLDRSFLAASLKSRATLAGPTITFENPVRGAVWMALRSAPTFFWAVSREPVMATGTSSECRSAETRNGIFVW